MKPTYLVVTIRNGETILEEISCSWWMQFWIRSFVEMNKSAFQLIIFPIAQDIAN